MGHFSARYNSTQIETAKPMKNLAHLSNNQFSPQDKKFIIQITITRISLNQDHNAIEHSIKILLTTKIPNG